MLLKLATMIMTQYMDKKQPTATHTSGNWLFYSYIAGSVIACGTVGYLYYLERAHNDAQLTTIRTQEQTLEEHRNTISTLETELFQTKTDRDEIIARYNEEKEQNDVFREQLEDLSGTINVLDQLAKTDEELLQKYSRVYFLNENYRPERLTQIDDDWVLAGKGEQYVHHQAWPYLEDMLEDAENDDIDLRVLSAFRSFEEQDALKGQFTRQYGSGANAFSADQGYSEHQLGTAVDIVDPITGATSQRFADTDAYEWLLDNAHKYGFTLSYPEGNEYYIFEPWHWRFVGVDLATDLYRDDAYFYDWDQRTINEYLITIFD